MRRFAFIASNKGERSELVNFWLFRSKKVSVEDQLKSFYVNYAFSAKTVQNLLINETLFETGTVPGVHRELYILVLSFLYRTITMNFGMRVFVLAVLNDFYGKGLLQILNDLP